MATDRLSVPELSVKSPDDEDGVSKEDHAFRYEFVISWVCLHFFSPHLVLTSDGTTVTHRRTQRSCGGYAHACHVRRYHCSWPAPACADRCPSLSRLFLLLYLFGHCRQKHEEMSAVQFGNILCSSPSPSFLSRWHCSILAVFSIVIPQWHFGSISSQQASHTSTHPDSTQPHLLCGTSRHSLPQVTR